MEHIDTIIVGIIVVGIIFTILLKYFYYRYERNHWNGGYCPLCGNSWRYLDKLYGGDRNYTCVCGNLHTFSEEFSRSLDG